jgi:hypothetical protein
MPPEHEAARSNRAGRTIDIIKLSPGENRGYFIHDCVTKLLQFRTKSSPFLAYSR